MSISKPEVSERDLRHLFVVHARAAKKLKRRCLQEPWHILKHTTSPLSGFPNNLHSIAVSVFADILEFDKY